MTSLELRSATASLDSHVQLRPMGWAGRGAVIPILLCVLWLVLDWSRVAVGSLSGEKLSGEKLSGEKFCGIVLLADPFPDGYTRIGDILATITLLTQDFSCPTFPTQQEIETAGWKGKGSPGQTGTPLRQRSSAVCRRWCQGVRSGGRSEPCGVWPEGKGRNYAVVPPMANPTIPVSPTPISRGEPGGRTFTAGESP
jgi:hypothetical protein